MKEKHQKNEHRCPCCKKLLFYGKIDIVEIKCPKCGKIITVK